MAILMRLTAPGATPEQQRGALAQVRDKMATFPGFIAHASGPADGGVYVIELWESKDAHERWQREVIAPLMRQAGVDGLPPVEYLQVDSIVTR